MNLIEKFMPKCEELIIQEYMAISMHIFNLSLSWLRIYCHEWNDNKGQALWFLW